MASMNSNLILQAAQTPDILGAVQAGNALAMRQNEQKRQNALADFYRDNAQGLMAGDTNAFAVLAQYDPPAAFGMQRQLQQDALRAEETRYQRDRDARTDARQDRLDARADEEWRLKIDEYAATKSQQEREAEAAQIIEGVQRSLAARSPQEYDAIVTEYGLPQYVGRFAERENIGRGYLSIADQLKGSGAGAVAKYGTTPMIGTDADGNQVIMQIGDNGTAVRTQLPEGVQGVDFGVQSRERAAGTAEGKARGEASAGLAGAADKAAVAIQNLQTIRNDPALSSITGMVQGRIPPMSQAGTDLNTRIQQAQGQAFLEAFAALKGGGAITEIEGQKAEQAMARLNRAQSTEAFQQAIDELSGILQAGVNRAYERAGKAAPEASDNDLLSKYGLR